MEFDQFEQPPPLMALESEEEEHAEPATPLRRGTNVPCKLNNHRSSSIEELGKEGLQADGRWAEEFPTMCGRQGSEVRKSCLLRQGLSPLPRRFTAVSLHTRMRTCQPRAVSPRTYCAGSGLTGSGSRKLFKLPSAAETLLLQGCRSCAASCSVIEQPPTDRQLSLRASRRTGLFLSCRQIE